MASGPSGVTDKTPRANDACPTWGLGFCVDEVSTPGGLFVCRVGCLHGSGVPWLHGSGVPWLQPRGGDDRPRSSGVVCVAWRGFCSGERAAGRGAGQPCKTLRSARKKLGRLCSVRGARSKKLRRPSGKRGRRPRKLSPPCSELGWPSKKLGWPSSELGPPSGKLRSPSSKRGRAGSELRVGNWGQELILDLISRSLCGGAFLISPNSNFKFPWILQSDSSKSQ